MEDRATPAGLYAIQVSLQGVCVCGSGLRAGPRGLVPETVTGGCLRMIGTSDCKTYGSYHFRIYF